MRINFYLTLLCIIFIGCSENHNRQDLKENDKDRISLIDTCQKINLTDSLYLGFMANMTKEQYYKHLDTLIAENKIKGNDTSVSIFLPYNLDAPKEFKLSVIPFFADCYLYMVRLAGFTTENNFPVSYIDDIMMKKYGKGIKSGYEDFIMTNGRIMDGIQGFETAMYQLKNGEGITGFIKRNNNEAGGKRLWNIKGVQISLLYDNSIKRIEIEYQSLTYLKQEKRKKEKKKRDKDSIYNIKIKSSSKSL